MACRFVISPLDTKSKNLGLWCPYVGSGAEKDIPTGDLQLRIASTRATKFQSKLTEEVSKARQKHKGVNFTNKIMETSKQLTAKLLVTDIQYKDYITDAEDKDVLDEEGNPTFKWVSGIPFKEGFLPVTELNVLRLFNDRPSVYEEVSAFAQEDERYIQETVEEDKLKSS